MQQPISHRDVYEPGMTARVAGRDLEVSQVQVDRSLPDPLVGGSLSAASASFTAVEGDEVVSTVATPWDPESVWPPAPEAAASVDMDMGYGPVSLLRNGRVVSASGGTDGRGVSVEAADQYQSLDQTISWNHLSAAQPAPGEAVTARYVGLQATAITDRILRHCGWYSTPPRLQYASLSVPAQGTMWPESGTCVTSGRVGNSDVYPYWGNADWGVAATDAEATYAVAGAYSIKSRGRVELTAMTMGQNSSSTSRIVAQGDGAFLFRLSWSDTTATLWVRSPSDTIVSAIAVPRADGLLYASMEYVNDTTVLASIRSGGTVQATTVPVSELVTTRIVRDATISVTGRASGFQIAFPSVGDTLADWTPNAVLYPRQSNRNNLMVAPSQEGASCVDLLNAQCEAECATYWIDETGVLRWWDLTRLEATETVGTLTSDDDIAESGFTWSHSLSSVKSRVTVNWTEPLRSWSWRSAIDLWQGSGETLQPGESKEWWIESPDDEAWIEPDLNFDRVGTSGMVDFNNGWGSHYGGVIAQAGDGPDSWAYPGPGSMLMTVERVTDRAFRATMSWTGSEGAVQVTPGRDTVGTDLWKRRRDFDLPIFRGKAKIVFTDRMSTSAQSGPASAPEHVIDAGWWIQSEAQAQYTADYAGSRLTVPQPTLSSVALIPVPGLQLGDTVEVQDTAVTRLTIRGVVIEDSRSIDDGMGMDHSVAIRPTSVTRNGVTWQEWGRVMNGQTWQTWGNRQQPDMWQEWGEDPLEVE